ncbi:hypothetical protein Enr13x_72510 [Stieleria neptunia]|uniref:Uncharacterized protein n=1 Tax=Stieleria neptunia TaxID=2527979 RepID=A0A518I2L4_9BACT|nr:hypothetical protein [Stieleria neptunia]QDV47342.1 hypothetical protein Enr13x_72510 [Stieleria neptunia]
MRSILLIAALAILSQDAWAVGDPEKFAEYRARLQQRRDAALEMRRQQRLSEQSAPQATRSAQTNRFRPALDGYVPQPALRGYVPQPALRGYTPRPALQGYVPRPALYGWAPRPALYGYAPGPALRGYTPQPALRGYTPRPALRGYTPKPALSAK